MGIFKNFFDALIRCKKKPWLTVCAAAVLIAIVAVGIILIANANSTPSFNDCTVTVKSEGGITLEGVNISVYKDESEVEPIAQATTNADGAACFDRKIPVGSIAVLGSIPAGYKVESYYQITTSSTEVILPIELTEEITELTPGCVMFDFTVTATNGGSYTLSNILKKKDAVVLNLWHTSSRSCEREFIFLQEAFDLYAKNVAVLGIDPNPTDDEESVKEFKESHALTIPMVKADKQWNSILAGIRLPSTIIIDRFGTVALIHNGPVGDLTSFTGALKFFTDDNYVQSVIDDIGTLKDDDASTEILGTKEVPLEFENVTEFEVSVPAGQSIYCSLYNVGGQKLEVKSDNLKILFNETEYSPSEGAISFLIPKRSNHKEPDLICFSNSGSADEVFKAILIPVEGSADNPIQLELGSTFTTTFAAGDPQGLCYTSTADKNGNFVLTIKNATADVNYNIAITNQTSLRQMILEDNAEQDANGNKTLSCSVMENDDIFISVGTYPNESGEYPAAEITMEISISEEDSSNKTEPIQIPEPEIVTEPIVDNSEAA